MLAAVQKCDVVLLELSKCFALLAGFTQGKRNYAAVLGGGLFILDGYKVRNVWTWLICRVCVLCMSTGQLHAPVKTGIWRVLFHLFHLATCHQLIHKVPRRPVCSPSRSCTHKHRQTQACICTTTDKFACHESECILQYLLLLVFRVFRF